MKAFFSKLGQTFMLPIALLPAAGIMLGIGGSFTNESMISAYGLESILGDGTFLNTFLGVMSAAGDIVFANLPVMFAIALAIGFAKKEKGAAALAALMAYLIMNVSIAQLMGALDIVAENGDLSIFGMTFSGMTASMLGVNNTLSMGVFGGIIAGGITAFLHNKFIDAKLPDFLGFFAGPRLVPIVASFAALFYGMALVFVWPFIGGALAAVGTGLGSLVEAGYGWVASLIFGLIERSLIPFGLHHVFYLPLWQTSVGGTYQIAGETIYGTQNAFFASLGAGDFSAFPATNFMSGKFPFMIFGLPAAAYAMYTVADEENKKEVSGLLFSVGFTAMLTGITEPIEFTFLFLAPFLYYGIHVPLAGISFMLMDILNVKVGMTFSGGLIDFTLFGILPGTTGADNNWYWIIIVGIVYAFIYFFLFRWYILKKDIATPGRGGAAVKMMSKAEYKEAKANGGNDQLVKDIIEALGGEENIVDVDACITRLRVTVKDNSKVQDNAHWQSLGASGVVINGNAIQAIYGAKAAEYKPLINAVLGNE
ncbi:PTS transporter subunit EIIC [Mollicutes bacterium LVI A0078]|nr:PTS transporter subunit EIIC [Mollicutes bacterium LVI A0075]WOO91063.1 PTS transporter subunit EIIC [Mollicutes bacterium LVI A0078]